MVMILNMAMGQPKADTKMKMPRQDYKHIHTHDDRIPDTLEDLEWDTPRIIAVIIASIVLVEVISLIILGIQSLVSCLIHS